MEKNKLPQGWTYASLENCVEILDGKRIPINSRERQQRQGDIPYYGATGQVGQIDNYIFNEELVLLGEDGAPFFDHFKNKAYLISGKSWVNNHAHVIKGISKLLVNKFLCNYLNQIDYHNYVNGTTRLKLNQTSMKTIPITLPPFNEQKRIVDKIEELFSELDHIETILNNIQLRLKQYLQSLLESAFNGNLTQNWRNEHISILESSYDLIERIKIDSNIPITDNLPEKWASTIVKNLFEVKGGSTPSRTNSSFWNGDISWISSGQVKNCDIYESKEKISQKGFDNSSLKIYPPETILMAMIGEGKTRGQVAILKIHATTNQNIASILCANSEILSKYIYFWLLKRYEATRRIGSGGMQKALNVQRVKEMPLILAPIKEQEQIVLQIEQNLSLLQNTKYVTSSMLNQLQILRSTILKQAFEGKLVPQDPNDEPASELLKRIKLEN